MTEVPEFKTVNSESGPFEFKEKGSRFISYTYPVSGKDQAEDILAGRRKKYFDSTHVCFGYRLGEGEEQAFRYSDDGEPSGTAGLPIMNEIRGKGLFNVLVLVVRYYGGTKLGTGGLARAYRDSAKLALENSRVIKKIRLRKESVSLPFAFEGELIKLVNRFSIGIAGKEYSAEGVRIELDIPVSVYDTFRDTLFNSSKGKINFI